MVMANVLKDRRFTLRNANWDTLNILSQATTKETSKSRTSEEKIAKVLMVCQGSSRFWKGFREEECLIMGKVL